jgi:ubiquinone biosynthesis protein UbiJ
MLQSVRALAAPVLPALQARVVLLVNHVLSREPVAMQRLRPHASRRVRVALTALPGWLPALPPVDVVITPAGLFELAEPDLVSPPDLSLRVAAPSPMQLLAALSAPLQPQVAIDGDAAFAADVSWIADNVRWDIEADLAELIGPLAAAQLARAARAIAAALRAAGPR